jgi:hypothetical protein
MCFDPVEAWRRLLPDSKVSKLMKQGLKLTGLEIVANVQILTTKILNECCFPRPRDSHHGNDDVIWTIGR